MARFAVGAKKFAVHNGVPSFTVGHIDDPVGGTAEQGIVSATATLVADGATPTQAHVTTLNTNLTSFNNNLAAAKDVIVSFDASTITSRSQLRQALAAIGQFLESSNAIPTP